MKNSDAVVVILSKSLSIARSASRSCLRAVRQAVIPRAERAEVHRGVRRAAVAATGIASVAAAPEFLRGILSIGVEAEQERQRVLEVGVRKVPIQREVRPLRLENGVTLQHALSTTLDDLERRGTTPPRSFDGGGDGGCRRRPTDDAARPPPPTPPPPPSPPMPGAVSARRR